MFYQLWSGFDNVMISDIKMIKKNMTCHIRKPYDK